MSCISQLVAIDLKYLKLFIFSCKTPATMSDIIFSFLILLFQGICCCSANTIDSFIIKPDKEVYSHEGSDVTLEWEFHVGASRSSSPPKVREFIFGYWVPPGFVREMILAVQKHNIISKGRGFEKKVDWSGNILGCVNCTAKVKMYNLTSADFKDYGVEVELGLDRRPLINWLKLVKFETARIIKWPWIIEVEEGNATAVECKATGRPTPSVIIKRKNQTLCIGIGYCLYDVPTANKSVHEGEYLCLVQQRKSVELRRSLNLTVIEVGKIPPTKNIADDQTTDTTTPQRNIRTLRLIVTVITSVGILIAVVCVLTVLKCNEPNSHSRHSMQDQERRKSNSERKPALISHPQKYGEEEKEEEKVKMESMEPYTEKEAFLEILMPTYN